MTAPPPHERRRGDRRRSDRRRPPSSGAEDTWFGVLGNAAHGAADTAAPADSAMPSDLQGADSRFLSREARRLVLTEGSALRRIVRTYIAARAALGIALVLAPWAVSVLGAAPPLAMVLLCLAYASQAVSRWLLSGPADGEKPSGRVRQRLWLGTVGVDLLAFSALHLLDPSGQLNYAALLVLPVLMSGVLMPRLAALATAAAVALLLLGSAMWRAWTGGSGASLLPLLQAGLAGVGAFVITLLSGELALRLAREERAARGSLELARQQAQLNRLVIEEMTDGVLVVDRRLRVRAANPAARALLGLAGRQQATPFGLGEESGWQPLLSAVEQAYAQGRWPTAARELTLHDDVGGSRQVQVRARFTRRSGLGEASTAPEDICVLFLEDMRGVQARVRQEKLAAMGRMSAGIAHEIRNPLAAITQANALLLEDGLAAPQQRLARIVEDNAVRLKRIVDDVMTVAAVDAGAASSTPIDAGAEIARICDEWGATAAAGAAGGARLQRLLPGAALPVLFDAEHLRRVLINLLDNAGRHGSDAPGAVRVTLSAGNHHAPAVLTVASDGAPITPEVERHLFEPFFSTRSRGTGLGLYICRELCERHGAVIDYRPGAPGERHRNQFRVQMRRAPAGAEHPR